MPCGVHEAHCQIGQQVVGSVPTWVGVSHGIGGGAGQAPAGSGVSQTESGTHWPEQVPPVHEPSAEFVAARDALGVARLLAAAVKPENPDLVLTGLQSDDLGYGQTGAILAELLGLPHATIVMHVQRRDGGIRVKRELEDGWSQYVDLPLPALLTIQSGISKLRYATLMGIKKAKTKPVRRVTAADLGMADPEGTPAARVTIGRLYFPERTRRTQLFEGNPRKAAAQLVEKLRFEARVI